MMHIWLTALANSMDRSAVQKEAILRSVGGGVAPTENHRALFNMLGR
jgi:hypothetical protein